MDGAAQNNLAEGVTGKVKLWLSWTLSTGRF
jgi:hypothetical protein